MAIIVFSEESDGDVAGTNFGTAELDDFAVGEVQFTIDLDNAILGTDADVHKFGFQSNYTGSLVVDDPAFSIAPVESLPALGKYDWNWVVSLGNGQPVIDPASFSVIGDANFSVDSILDATPLSINGNAALVGVHAQATATPAGSETVYGSQAGDPASVAEPASLFAFSMIVGMVVGSYIRKRLR